MGFGPFYREDAPSTDHDILLKDLSKSIFVGTRKMVKGK